MHHVVASCPGCRWHQQISDDDGLSRSLTRLLAAPSLLGCAESGGTFRCLGRGHVDFPGCRLPPQQLEGACSADNLQSCTQAPSNRILWHCRLTRSCRASGVQAGYMQLHEELNRGLEASGRCPEFHSSQLSSLQPLAM